jgi:hypothetical protein
LPKTCVSCCSVLRSVRGESWVSDPGFRTGCKVICLDANGNLLYNTAIYPHEPQNRVFESQAEVEHLVDKYAIEAISVGQRNSGPRNHGLSPENQIRHARRDISGE